MTLKYLLDSSKDDNDLSSEVIDFETSTRYGFIIISEALYSSTIYENRDNHFGNVELSQNVVITESTTTYTNKDLGIDTTDTANEFFTGSYLGDESSGLMLNTRDINDSSTSVSLDLKVHYIQTNIVTDIITTEEGGNNEALIVIKYQDTDKLLSDMSENGIHPQNFSLSVFNVNNTAVSLYSFNNNNLDERTYKLTVENDKSYPLKIIHLLGLSDGSIYGLRKEDTRAYEESDVVNHSHSYSHANFSHTH